MTSRFLTVAAIAGMLVASGCGGGAGTSTSSLTPGAPTSGGNSTSSGRGGSLTATFLIPQADLGASTSSSSRSPQYISPGSTGIQVLLGNGTLNSLGGASGNAQLFQLFGPNGGTNWGAAANTSVVQLTPGSFNPAPVVGQSITFVNVGGTAFVGSVANAAACAAGGVGVAAAQGSIFAAAGGTFMVCTGVAATAAPLTFTIGQAPQANGSLLTGSITIGPLTGTLAVPTNLTGFNTVATPMQQTIPVANTLVAFAVALGTGQTFVIGTAAAPATVVGATAASPFTLPLATGVYGQQAGSTVSYYGAPSSKAGYIQATVTFTNLVPGANFDVGIILSSLANNNFVLSEGQVPGNTVTASGQAVANLTLLPVVAGVIAAVPAFDQLTTVAGGATAGSYETTLFLTDKAGFIIPTSVATANQVSPQPAPNADNAPTVALSTLVNITPVVATALTFGYWQTPAASGAAANTNASLQAIPANAFTAGALAAVSIGGAAGLVSNANAAGWFFPNVISPTAPGLPTLNGGALGAAAGLAGIPLNITCSAAVAGTAAVGFQYTLTSAVQNTVVGFTPVAGTNYPAATTTAPLGTVNCVPGIVTNVN